MFRQVIYRNKNVEINIMNLKPEEDVGIEIHPKNDQIFFITLGSGKAILNDTDLEILKPGKLLIVPAGTKHNVIAGKYGLSFYTVYVPPEMPLNKDQLKKTNFNVF